ncbi:MAG TPA: biotin--[acetyl-CoA-carboxylase] ligase [Lacipirellulaceae bacterium]|nr:biotin--[acetyl-CoA-carboxylase] ligase [Lacipirellulaceae bacterium]
MSDTYSTKKNAPSPLSDEEVSDTFLRFDAGEIRSSTFVRHFEFHESLESTNDRAAQLARDPVVELPALIAARHQTAGRGRGKNIWWSIDGALTFSMLLEPAAHGIRVANWPQLSLATSVAVCDALEIELQRAGVSSPPVALADAQPRSDPPPARTGRRMVCNPRSLRLAIKWPNDVVLDSNKICGILIESPSGAAPAKHRLIIGIGINVNNSLRFAPPDLVNRSTSLFDASGKQHSLQKVLIQTLDRLEQRIIQLEHRDVELSDAWQKRCWLSGRKVRIQTARRSIEGDCVGIADDGALVVCMDGATERIYDGSVQVL